jgi:hypothetical protein
MKRALRMLWTAALVVAAFGLIAPVHAAVDTKAGTPVKNIDIVICLDTSNSMDGLIGSAKAKLWDIVNDMAKIKPAPQLRVGLYSYGNDTYDAKIGWIRKELDLTTDLDALYEKLFGLRTQGGTEYVTRVCRDAIDQQKWSDDPKALKIIFVCGNEPASQDPVVKLKEAAEKAKAKGIVINPIYCGGVNDRDAADWKDLAALAGGRFASINQERGVVAIATPQDKELAELSARLNTTYVLYGGKGNIAKQQNQLAQDGNASKAGAGVAAARANAKACDLYRCDSWDLVDRCKNDPKFDVKKLADAELNDEMKKMKPEEREKYVKEMASKREGLQKQIVELNKKRDAYVAAEQKKAGNKADKAFDEAIRGALRDQASAKGIVIPKDE